MVITLARGELYLLHLGLKVDEIYYMYSGYVLSQVKLEDEHGETLLLSAP